MESEGLKVVISIFIAGRQYQNTAGGNVEIREATAVLAIQGCAQRVPVLFEEIDSHGHAGCIGIGNNDLARPAASRHKFRK